MNKDVIYIDVEDDITSIIGKVKVSKEKIVALVPPKRVGVLQSAVNLRLLDRAANSANKRLVLITNNHALIALAAATKMPVAKNLQSKPELPEIAALEVDDGDDVIDGASLPVGELAKTVDKKPESETDTAAGELIDSIAAPPTGDEKPAKPKKRRGVKVPNFSSFRKKLFLGIAGAIGLVIFLVWAIGYAPRATVVITARTTSANVAQTVSLSPEVATNFSTGVIRAIRKEQKKEASIAFDATGEKNLGDKAAGTVTLNAKKCTGNPFVVPNAVPAGTTISAGDKSFVTQSAVSFSGNGVDGGCYLYSGAPATAVTATDAGSGYNLTNATFAVSGRTDVTGTGSTAGGTDKIVKIVTAADVQKATEALAAQEDKAVKPALIAEFGKTATVIDASYALAKSDPVSVPAVGVEAPGKAKLTTQITYSMFGIAQPELSTYLNAALKKQIEGKADQRIYDNGGSNVTFSSFVTESANTKVRISATGRLGPQIKDSEVKAQVKGKRFGDIQSELGKIDGVENVDTQFWPFWVQEVPMDEKRITVEFKLNDKK